MKYKAGTRVECIREIYDTGGTDPGIDAGTQGIVRSDSHVAPVGHWDADDVFRYYDTEVALVMFETGIEVPSASHRLIVADVDNLRETVATPNDLKLSDSGGLA